jgi:hypothetical protein
LKTKVASAASIVAIMFLLSTATAQGAPAEVDRVVSAVPASQVVNGDYFAFMDCGIAGTINGDLYVRRRSLSTDREWRRSVAGGRVSLSGTVSQDVRAAGGR